MKLKPYPEYKASGLSWLRELPKNWDVFRAKNVFKPIDVRSETGAEELLSVSEKHGVSLRKNTNVTVFQAESYEGYKLCWPGDLVINSLWAWMQGLGFSDRHGIVSTAYGVYRPKAGHKEVYRYFDYLLRSAAYLWELRVRSKGIYRSRYQLNDDAFFTMPIILPSKDEQHKIVRFLDVKSRQISHFIRNKRRLIELLREQKQAIINRAVTRGLNPDARLKASGIDWLGDIPAHWEILPLKYLSKRIQNGATPPTDRTQYYEDGVIPWYGPSSIGSFSELGEPVRCLNKRAFVDGKARLIKGPAVMVVVIGATAGRVGLLMTDGSSNQQITSFEIDVGRVKPQFATFQLGFAQHWLRETASTATIPIIDSAVLNRVALAIPDIEEQDSILSWISSAAHNLNSAISRTQLQIGLIREYRTRLIADVVTGKMDVRDIPVETVPEDDAPEDLVESEEMEEALDVGEAEE